MTKKLSARTAKTRRLGQQDAANRCATCRRAMTAKRVERFGDERPYCSHECVREMIEREIKSESWL